MPLVSAIPIFPYEIFRYRVIGSTSVFMNEPPARIKTVPKVPMQRAKAITIDARIPLFANGSEMLMKVSKNKEKYKNLINYEHSGMVFSGDEIYSYENWLVGDNPRLDKSYEIFGREFAPGTWLTTLHFTNKRIFEEFVLSNRTTGLSLEGVFQEVPFRFMEEVKDEEFIDPRPGESEDEFVSRCVSNEMMIGEFPDEKQRLAVCYSYYQEKMETEAKDTLDKLREMLSYVEKQK